MAIYAVIKNSMVINMIVAEPGYIPQEEVMLVEVPSDLPVTIGHVYNDPYFFNFEGNQVLPYVEEIEIEQVTQDIIESLNEPLVNEETE